MIQISAKDFCCGCTACAEKCPQQCIVMQEDNEGFRYPFVNADTCIECGLCEKVCPALSEEEVVLPLHAYAARNKDEGIRRKSSSGGVFTLLAEKVIADGGVIFGARFDENWEVCHDYTETIEGLAAFRGSKYVQSRMGNSYQKADSFLKQGRKVLFSGTPCQIAGLRRYLNKEYSNLLTVDFICHGVPSPKVWRKYLQEIIARKGATGKNSVLSSLKFIPVITDINFRDKSAGWKKFGFVLRGNSAFKADENSALSCYTFSETWVSETLDVNAYMCLFLTNICLRPSCHTCKFRSGKNHSDIKLADFWGVEVLYPEYFDDKGISWLLAMSPKGELLIDAVKDELLMNECDFNIGMKYNSSFSTSCMEHPKRKDFFENMEENTIGSLVRNYCSMSVKTKCLRIVRYIIGKILGY